MYGLLYSARAWISKYKSDRYLSLAGTRVVWPRPQCACAESGHLHKRITEGLLAGRGCWCIAEGMMTEVERICWGTCAYHLTLQWGKFSKWLHTFPVYVQCTKQKFKIVSIAWVTFVYQPLEDVVHWLVMHYQVMDLEAGKVMIHAQVFGSWLVSYYVILISSVLCHTVIALFVYQPLEDVVHWLFMHYQVMDLEAGKVMVHARVFGSWLVVYYVILLLHYSYSMSACFVTQTLQLRMQSDTI